MALFNRKKNKDKVLTAPEVLSDYIEKSINSGSNMDYVVKILKESNRYNEDDINFAIELTKERQIEKEKNKEELELENKLKKDPKRKRSHLKKLYQDYKNGNILLPEGYDKNKFLEKKKWEDL